MKIGKDHESENISMLQGRPVTLQITSSRKVNEGSGEMRTVIAATKRRIRVRDDRSPLFPAGDLRD